MKEHVESYAILLRTNSDSKADPDDHSSDDPVDGNSADGRYRARRKN